MTDFVSIHNINDIDVYQFSLDAVYLLDLNLDLVGPSNTGSPVENDLVLKPYSWDARLLWSADAGGAGFRKPSRWS